VLISDKQVVFHKSRKMRRKKYKEHSNSMMNYLRIENKYLLNIYLDSQIRNLTSDLEQAREQLDEEQEAKSEFQKQVTKLNAEVQQWRSRYESEG
jgi:predicted nuclease with TOPRIM domain